MASIVKRNNSYCVVYTYKHTNGTQKQKWETFTDLTDAKNRKKEVEYKESVGTFVAPQCRTLKDLLTEYVALYGKTKWALSTYQSNNALISNYIIPLIGSMKLQDLTTRVIEGYYQRLLKYEAVDPMCGKRQHQYVSPGTVRSVAVDCSAALQSVGFDPCVGFLHRPRPGRKSLALDLMEELRPVYADRFVLSCINQKLITAKHCLQQENGSVLLTEEGRRVFLKLWQQKKAETITHPFLKEKIPWGLVPYVQALLLARTLRGDLSLYPPFFWK